MIFYRNIVTAALEMAPSQTMRAITEEVVGFEMPGSIIPGFSRKAVQMAKAGIYDLRIHHDDIVTPLLRQWGVWELEGLDEDGEKARDELAAAVSALDGEATRFVERRDGGRGEEGRAPGGIGLRRGRRAPARSASPGAVLARCPGARPRPRRRARVGSTSVISPPRATKPQENPSIGRASRPLPTSSGTHRKLWAIQSMSTRGERDGASKSVGLRPSQQ